MQDERSDLESRTEELARRLARVERRLAALEDGYVDRETVSPADRRTDGTLAPAREGETPGFVGTTLPLIGRTLLVLAGAFLLRAFTEGGMLPQGVGTGIGIAYAMLWIMLSDRDVSRDRRTSATFHGLAAAIIAFPLLFEATVRFEFLSPPLSAAALSAITAAALIVAFRKSLRRLAWVFAAGAAATALALAVATKMLVLFASVLIVLGLATLWLGYLRGWQGPGWLAAFAADTAVLLMTVMSLAAKTPKVEELLNPASLVTLQLALMVVYLGSFAGRTLFMGKDVAAEEILQGTAVLGIGLGGAVAVTGSAGLPGLPVGAVSLLLAACCYAAAFAWIDRREGVRKNFISYTTVALVLILVGLGVLLEPAAMAIALAGAALFTSWLGARRSRPTLSLHGAVYVVAAVVVSGLGGRALANLLEPEVATGRWLTVPMLVVMLVTAACGWCRVATRGKTWGRFSRAPKLVLLAALVVAVDGVAAGLIAPLLPAGGETAIDAGALAALRTGIMAVTAVALAWLGRSARFTEAAWLVYPMLVLGGIKLLIEDLRAGRPATLVVSLALYGGALILAPRLARRAARRAPRLEA